MTPELLTEADVARHLRVGKSTVRRWRETGKLPHLRAGAVVRYRPGDVEAFKADHFVDAAPVEFTPLRAVRGRR